MSSDIASYWAIITAAVLFDDQLKNDEKILFAHISALTKKDGYCFATNAYFAQKNVMNCDKATISRRISKLEKRGHIKTQIIYAEDGKTIEQRRIYIMTLGAYIGTPIDRIINRGIDDTINTPIDASVKDNINKVFNINKPLKKPRKKPIPSKVETSDDSVVVTYPRYSTTRRFVSPGAS